MKLKLLPILAVLLLVVSLFVLGSGKLLSAPDYSEVELSYENDGRTRYYYDRLSPNAKLAYTMILPKLYEHSEKIEIPEITSEDFDSLMYALSYDNPELFCLGTQSSLKTEGRTYYYCPSYTCSEQECLDGRSKLDGAVKKALSGISMGADDYEKELYVHDYICKICRYDAEADKLQNISAYSVLVDGNAVCEGYAKAAKLLLDKLGVSNYLITGDAEDGSGKVTGHMWNIVSVNSQNYHLDITWDDMDAQELFDGNHIYFNVDDDMIGKTHFNFNPAENNCKFTDYNYGSQTKMRFSKYDDTARKSIINNIYSNYKKGKKICEFSFTGEREYKTALEDLTQNGGINRLFGEIYKTYPGFECDNVQYVADDELYAFMFVFS